MRCFLGRITKQGMAWAGIRFICAHSQISAIVRSYFALSSICNCPVLFRIVKHGCVTRLQIDGKHSNSHDVDHSRGLNLQQRAAVQSVALAHPTSSARQVRCNLGIQEKVVNVSPSKHSQVLRVVKQVRETVFNNFTSGQRVDNSKGSLTRLSTSIFFKILVAEHNCDGKHLSLHSPICLSYQFPKKLFLVPIPHFSCSKMMRAVLQLAGG
jgi:hypothetical protein